MVETAATTVPPLPQPKLRRFTSLEDKTWLETVSVPSDWNRTPTSSLVTDISKILERLAAEGVYLRDVHQLQDYLERFPGILDVLYEAIRAVEEHLPEGALFLGIYRDPEIEDCYPVLCVRVKEYDETFGERLEKAEAQFIGRLTCLKGWLQLTTDFRDPEDAF